MFEIAIEYINEDSPFEYYAGLYLFIVKEEQDNESKKLTGYFLGEDGKIVMDIGLLFEIDDYANYAGADTLEKLFGFDFNGDNEIWNSLTGMGITWEDETHIARMFGFEDFSYSPGNTDLFVDYSSENGDIYFSPSDLNAWDAPTMAMLKNLLIQAAAHL